MAGANAWLDVAARKDGDGMSRWLLILLLCVGCGSSNLVAPEPDSPAEVTFDHVSPEELETYISQVNTAFRSIDVLFAEYGGVTGEATSGLVSTYWSRQFASTMIERIHAITATLHGIRPPNPYLHRLHVEELEGAFEDYLNGVTFFEQNLHFLTPEILDGLNDHMGQGNVHIIRLQIFLSDLAGRNVVLGEQGPGFGEGQDIGL